MNHFEARQLSKSDKGEHILTASATEPAQHSTTRHTLSKGVKPAGAGFIHRELLHDRIVSYMAYRL